jgi:hypothetical protein
MMKLKSKVISFLIGNIFVIFGKVVSLVTQMVNGVPARANLFLPICSNTFMR